MACFREKRKVDVLVIDMKVEKDYY
jgi:hypothetical protein